MQTCEIAEDKDFAPFDVQAIPEVEPNILIEENEKKGIGAPPAKREKLLKNANSAVRSDGTKQVDLEDAKKLRKLESTVKRGSGKFVEVGFALKEIRDFELWVHGGYTSWTNYCSKSIGCSRQNCNLLISGAEIASPLLDLEVDGLSSDALRPLSEAQVRHLVRFDDPERRKAVWVDAVKAKGGLPTEKEMKKIVDDILGVENPDGGATEKKNRKINSLIAKIQMGVLAIDDPRLRHELSVSVDELFVLLNKGRNS